MEKEEKTITVSLMKVKLETAKEIVKIIADAIKQVEGKAETETQAGPGETLTYKTIMERLYNENPRTYYPTTDDKGGLRADCVMDVNMKNHIKPEGSQFDWDNCMTKAQAWRIQAFNKLQNIAVYLNDVEWKPNFELNQDGYRGKAYCIVRENGQYKVIQVNTYCALVYFQTKEKAEQAIMLMGGDLLEDLFNTEWQ